MFDPGLPSTTWASTLPISSCFAHVFYPSLCYERAVPVSYSSFHALNPLYHGHWSKNTKQKETCLTRDLDLTPPKIVAPRGNQTMKRHCESCRGTVKWTWNGWMCSVCIWMMCKLQILITGLQERYERFTLSYGWLIDVLRGYVIFDLHLRTQCRMTQASIQRQRLKIK